MSLLRRENTNGRQNPAPQVPMPPRVAARRELHEDAARFAQNVIDLEEMVARLKKESDAWERQASLAEGEVQQLRASLQNATAKSDYFQRRCTEMLTKLHTAGKIILDTINEDPHTPYRPAGEAAKVNIDAIAEELRKQAEPAEEQPLPRVIAAGPRIRDDDETLAEKE